MEPPHESPPRIAALATLALCATPVSAQTGTTIVGKGPGVAGAAQTVKVSATITAIDPATRVVTLKGPQGNEFDVTAGPEVKNFAQMKVGDSVDVEYVEALTLELKKGGGMPVARTDKAGAAGAKPGASPAGVVGTQVTVVADVVDVDKDKGLVTVKGPKRTIDLKVRDPTQLALIAKGDQVQATYTEALAMSVAPREVVVRDDWPPSSSSRRCRRSVSSRRRGRSRPPPSARCSRRSASRRPRPTKRSGCSSTATTRFVAGRPIHCDLRAQVRETKGGQAPFAAVVGCIDSRVPPELVFDQQLGDMFCARIAGNFINDDIIGQPRVRDQARRARDSSSSSGIPSAARSRARSTAPSSAT